MTYSNLDEIVRRKILDSRLTLHWYLQFLSYAAACVRERAFDTLQLTNTVSLKLDSYMAVDLPCDYQGLVQIGIAQGQFVSPITQRLGINNLNNLNTQGQPIPFSDPQATFGDFPYYPGYFMFSNVDAVGENLGRLYGLNSGLVNTSYKLIETRNQIQFSEDFPATSVVLEYFTNGETVDNATRVPLSAYATIQAYIDWKWKEDSRRSNISERERARRQYAAEWRYLRARRQNTSLEDIRQSLLKAYNGAIKV